MVISRCAKSSVAGRQGGKEMDDGRREFCDNGVLERMEFDC